MHDTCRNYLLSDVVFRFNTPLKKPHDEKDGLDSKGLLLQFAKEESGAYRRIGIGSIARTSWLDSVPGQKDRTI